MAQLTVRNIDERVVRRLKIRAAHNNRSAEAEHRAILEQSLVEDHDTFWERAKRLRERLGARDFGDSAERIREDRDRRVGLRDE